MANGKIIIECPQTIPCNPCVDACRFGAIQKKNLNACPTTVQEKCTGCRLCVAACPGQAIFYLVEDYKPGFDAVTFPYEYLPLPAVGQIVIAVNAEGESLCPAEVLEVSAPPAYNRTTLVTLQVPQPHGKNTRMMKRLGRDDNG